MSEGLARTDREIRDDDHVNVGSGYLPDAMVNNPTLRAAHFAMRDSRMMVHAYFLKLAAEDAVRRKRDW